MFLLEWLWLKRYIVINVSGVLELLECYILVRVEIGIIFWKFGIERLKFLLFVGFDIIKDKFYLLKKN